MAGRCHPGHDAPPRVGVSACLLGQNTRYDGGNRLEPVIAETLGAVAELVPVCPEMETGMGSPRPPIRLVGGPEGLRARGVDDPAFDVTEALVKAGLRQTGLSGFVLKSRSPSCGLGDVDVFSPDSSIVSASGYGVFAQTIVSATPLLPVEEEGAMSDTARRGAFLLRVFVYDEWLRAACGGDPAFGDFVRKTGFARDALDSMTRQDLDSLAGRAIKGGGAKYAAIFLMALRDAPPEGAIGEAADQAAGILRLRKLAVPDDGRFNLKRPAL